MDHDSDDNPLGPLTRPCRDRHSLARGQGGRSERATALVGGSAVAAGLDLRKRCGSGPVGADPVDHLVERVEAR